MNTRQNIIPSADSAVLAVSFSSTGNRFITGLSDGIRILRIDNCLSLHEPEKLPRKGGVGVVALLDDRYLAVVGGGRVPASSPNVLIFWDALQDVEISKFDLYEPILGLRMSSKHLAVILIERTVVFEYQRIEGPTRPTESVTSTTLSDVTEKEGALDGIVVPNRVKALYQTSFNNHALACLGKEVLILPAQSIGQVQVIRLTSGTKRILRAHKSALAAFTLSDDGSILATSSELGTLIRVFDIETFDQLAEFRRGSDSAVIFSLAISRGNRWLACTSDKGTLHIFDLRPPESDVPAATDREAPVQRRQQSHAGHRLSAGTMDRESLSGMSGRSSPGSAGHQGSVQEYYGLRPVPTAASPPTAGPGVSAIAAFRQSPFAPRFLKDARSAASAPFHIGDYPRHWQGGASHSWTVQPNGTRKKVFNPVPPLPNDSTGRPPKGIITFAPFAKGKTARDDDKVTLYVIGGGSDPRWEQFELAPAEGGGKALINKGFRKYLTKQFVD
ncbi:hypothetical protein MBLNU230_g6804t1 [Neophaeotheca triangularis]